MLHLACTVSVGDNAGRSNATVDTVELRPCSTRIGPSSASVLPTVLLTDDELIRVLFSRDNTAVPAAPSA